MTDPRESGPTPPDPSGTSSGTSQKRTKPLFRHPWRVAILAIGLVAVLNLGVILAANSDTTPGGKASLPTDIESISPANGALAGLVDDVTVNLADSYTGVLVIDGVEIPEDQLDRVEELGVITFRPGADKEFSRFRAGDNTVEVLYWLRTKPRPDKPARFGWRFRAAA
jgi:hypothetical protein